jgi:hypothetical protein
MHAKKPGFTGDFKVMIGASTNVFHLFNREISGE